MDSHKIRAPSKPVVTGQDTHGTRKNHHTVAAFRPWRDFGGIRRMGPNP